MFNAEADQPADWMRFSKTRFVTWHEIEGAILRAGSTVAALVARKCFPVDYLLRSRSSSTALRVRRVAARFRWLTT